MNRKKHIFLSSPHMSREGYEKNYIKEAFDDNWIAPLGGNVNGLEKEVAKKLGAKKAVALSSGTAAIHMALKSIGVAAGDIVFCQSLTFAASANPIFYENAVPVFIDSERDTWNMSPEALRKGLEKYKRNGKLPKAVIVVHLYGNCCYIEEIASICKEYHVQLIEDAAESLGTICHGSYTGIFGDYGIISLNGNKIITSSGGGMLLINAFSDAEKKAEKVVFWSTQARDKARWYEHSEVGYNYRMSNIVAGIGRGQLKVLEERVQQKRKIYEYYKRELGGLDGLQLMPIDKVGKSNCWLSCVTLSSECRVRPMDIILALEGEDIESRPVWKPLHLQPVFEGCDFISEANDLKITNREMGADSSVAGMLFENGLCLPSDTKMEEEDLRRVCSVIKKLWR